MHVELDPPPHVLEDVIGLRIAPPEPNWRERPDMNADATARFRAGMVARARYVEDIVVERVSNGVTQYVILGAGLDTFAQRRPDVAARVRVFEVDQPGPQEWKRRRLGELGLEVPDALRFVPVDFESGDSWWDRLAAAGFEPDQPAVVASTGVSMYLTKAANAATLRQLAALSPGSTAVVSFLLPLELVDAEDQPGFGFAIRGAQTSGTPFISFYSPSEMLEAAHEAGFVSAEIVSSADLNRRYFSGRSDGLRSSSGENLLSATT
jgi:methyltransferase (TIGR00027 family)